MRRATKGSVALLICAATMAASHIHQALANSPPVVTNVVAQQIAGTGQVRISFDVSDADGDQVTARVICSSNNGTTFDLLPVTVSGDVNHAMSAGPGKQIVWNAASDYPGRYWAQVVAKVICSDGPALSGEMVAVPAGSFTMGNSGAYADNQPAHTVTLNAYYIDKYEVTNADFQRFIDAGGYSTQAFWSAAGWQWKLGNGRQTPSQWGSDQVHSGPGWPGFPVAGVSWYEAEAYANFVGKRLPTEAEWERAARGTDFRQYPWGSQGLSQSLANYWNSGDPYETGSTPVGFYNGQLFPSPPFQTTDSQGPYGTYDQAGNVAEWVADWYDGNYYAASPGSNPNGPLTGSYKVIRGGSWAVNSNLGPQLNGTDLSSWTRYYYLPYQGQPASPSNDSRDVGFRCARTGP